MKNDDDTIRESPALKIGFASTGIVSVILIFSILDKIHFYCNWDESCFVSYNAFDKMGLNEIGDMLAGFAGALALIWIVVAVFMQREELRAQKREIILNRQELKMTRNVLGEQSAAAKKQAIAAEEQTKILQLERHMRLEEKAELELQEIFLIANRFFSSATDASFIFNDLKPEPVNQNSIRILKPKTTKYFNVYNFQANGENIIEYLASAQESVSLSLSNGLENKLLDALNSERYVFLGFRGAEFFNSDGDIKFIVSHLETLELGVDSEIRLRRSSLKKLLDDHQKIVDVAKKCATNLSESKTANS